MATRSLAQTAAALAGLMLALGGCADDKGPYADPVPYCAVIGTIDHPDARYIGPVVPEWMAAALRRAMGAPSNTPLEAFQNARWRCTGANVVACPIGANTTCAEKADTATLPKPSALAFCREHPDGDEVPINVTGRTTVYLWVCHNGWPTIARRIHQVDPQGYPARFWYRVAPLGTRSA